jgi:hypothetical protein
MRTRTPMFRVEIEAHHVQPRWHIDQRTTELASNSAPAACERVIRWAHGDLGIPPWKPCVRRSLEYTSATRLDVPEPELATVTPLKAAAPAQLELWSDQELIAA